MSFTNCEICGRVIPAAESSTGVHLKTYCGCDRTRTEKRALNPDATGQLSSDAPLRKTGIVKKGRPAPLGQKVPVGIRLTPDVVEFCKQHPDGFVFLETLCRKSKEFREWVKQK